MRGRPIFGVLLVLAIGMLGCSDDDDVTPDCGSCYLPPTSTDNVLFNFQIAYRARSIDKYSELLASDFQFYFDPATQTELGISYWTRTTDSLRTESLFNEPDVTNISIDLGYPAGDDSVTGAGKERWRHKRVTDVFLDVDVMPPGYEVTTFRVEDQTQDFYFRKGYTPADTAASSPTARNWYLVEWRDRGKPTLKAGSALTVSPSTWSKIKSLVR